MRICDGLEIQGLIKQEPIKVKHMLTIDIKCTTDSTTKRKEDCNFKKPSSITQSSKPLIQE